MTPRLRIFAGPNGSGKTTMAHWLAQDYAVNLYHHINADVLFAEIKKRQVTACPFAVEHEALQQFAQASTYPEPFRQPFLDQRIRIEQEFVVFERDAINSYTVALLADFYRQQRLQRRDSFSFETVFSHPGKIDILKDARARGYRTYMYFVATESPAINISRVQVRTSQGGHDVPKDKIIQRFERCLKNAQLALPWLNRAYFFDNSGDCFRLVAEYCDGKCQSVGLPQPAWLNLVKQAVSQA